MKANKSNKGITLIALVVTIIILLILAGITISFMLGDNGLLNRTKNAGESYSEQAARERLELALADLTAAKLTDIEYNENQYIDDNLTRQGMIVNGDMVIVDGWQFEIDRSVPKIASSLGKGKENEQIQIEASSTTSSDYTKVTIQFKISYTGEIGSIKIQGEEITIPTAVENVYMIEKEVTANGKYTIVVQDKEGNYKTGSIEITEITQDMEIWNKRDLETFRDNVNSGRSYEGKTVKVMADIDLEGSETNQWVPITNFKGIIDGKYHVISNLYIQNSQLQNLGLFQEVGKEAIISNIQLNNCYIENNYDKNFVRTGGITGTNYGIITNCGISGEIKASIVTDKSVQTGGIVGCNYGEVSNSYNESKVTSIKTSTGKESNGYAGGIVGYNLKKVIGCYNKGEIYSSAAYSRSGGICSFLGSSTGEVNKCYNIGKVIAVGTATMLEGGIVASNGNSTQTKGIIKDSYCLDTNLYASYYYSSSKFKGDVTGVTNEETLKKIPEVLKDIFKDDKNNVNNGYPILNWQ